MDAELKSLRIERKSPRADGPSAWAGRWIIGGVTIFILLGLASVSWRAVNTRIEVEVFRVPAPQGGAAGSPVALNATGYVVAAHKIQVASKVVGRVAWIGVDKGDKVHEGQVLARLEDDEYRAQLQQVQGQLTSLQARLRELEAGSRPEEIAAARANADQARADLANARINLDRTRQLHSEGVFPRQNLDDAQSRFDAAQARVESLQRTYELVRLGPRKEQIDSMRGQVDQAKGAVAFFETQLANTVIRAPVSGTILERIVERGEFVTTSFVGDRGAKGFVVSLADLNDLEVELDISQNDFNKLGPRQKAVITVDAYPDRKWDGVIDEISPEANRQKATVQVKVKVLKPDEYLRPEMNATVAFIAEEGAAPVAQGQTFVYVPLNAVRDGKVYVVLNDRVVERQVRTGPAGAQGLRVDQGLIGGEDIVLHAPPGLKDGAKVRRKGS
jgi:HlyD family secretion protein